MLVRRRGGGGTELPCAPGETRIGEIARQERHQAARGVSVAGLAGEARLRPERVVAQDRRRMVRVRLVELDARPGGILQLVAVDLADPVLRLREARSLVAPDRLGGGFVRGEQLAQDLDRLARAPEVNLGVRRPPVGVVGEAARWIWVGACGGQERVARLGELLLSLETE